MRPALSLVPLALAGPVLALAASAGSAWTTSARWSALTSPKLGTPRVIGSYSAGCLQGAVALAPEGEGFEVLHLGRVRYFGHPLLVRYVRELAAAAAEKGLPSLLVGDLSQPRGGPTPTDHASHQSGLDVDIAYTRPREHLEKPLSAAERESAAFVPVVDLQRQRLNDAWDDSIPELLRLAAADPAVDRIFVNPVVKRQLCALEGGGAPWLARLRPWWGHHDHFHVRLGCPEGSRACRAQPPLRHGDGCGLDLAWWFTNDARAAAKKRRPPPPGFVRRAALPAACKELLR